MRTSSFLIACLQCIHVLVSPEEHGERDRRDLSMLRMGKRDHVEVVPARSIGLPPLVPPNYDIGDEFESREILMPDEEIPRQIWIPRVGKDLEYEGRYVRAPPFPRLGKTFEDYLNEFRRDLNDEEERQIYLKYPRVGRSARHRRAVDDDQESVGEGAESEDQSELKNEQKRSLPFPRLGLYQEKRAPMLPRLGLMERASPMLPRLGLDDEYLETVERSPMLPRLGLRDEEFNEIQERALPLPRMGYMDKRAMGMLRMGRSGEALQEEEEKRGVSMLRMGKRAMGMLRMGKRPMNMLRMGRSQDSDTQEEKRAMSMLRMGKRAMGMLRMGRSDGSETDTEEEKRAMGMLRMGKRGMGMLRMGRSDNSEGEKRAMGMLRMGKRPMSMLRMGRSENAEPEQEKRAMGMLRMGKRPVSMLRMGKRDTDNVANTEDKTDS